MTERGANYDGGVIMASAETDLFEGDVYDADADRPSSLEVELFLAVIARVWEDAFVCSNPALKNTDRRCSPDIIRAEARRWLLLDHGEWKTDREDVCTMAGLDPDAIHRAALRRRELAVVEDAERNAEERAYIDRLFMAMLEREADGRSTAPQITASLRVLAEREVCLGTA